MNILIVDDRISSSFYLLEWMKNNGFIYFEAFNLIDAQSFWNDRERNPIHCIILDLNLPTDGMNDLQKEKSMGGLIAGWIWFNDVVLANEPKMRQKTIIYSDYIRFFTEKVPSNEYRGISLIPKRQRYSSAEDVVNRIKEISKINNIE